MRRGGRGNKLQAPWRRNNDPTRSSVQLRHWEASRLRRLTTVAACSIAISVIIWNSRLEPSKGRHLPTHNLRSRKGFVFPLYYSYRQLPNANDDLEGEMWREGGTANGRGLLEGSHPFLFNVTGRRLNEIDMKLIARAHGQNSAPEAASTYLVIVDTPTRSHRYPRKIRRELEKPAQSGTTLGAYASILTRTTKEAQEEMQAHLAWVDDVA